MGIFDSLLGLNTNSALNAATQQANANLGAVGKSNDTTLRNYSNLAGGVLQQYDANAGGELHAGQDSALAALANGGSQAQTALANGVNNAVGTVQGSNAQYSPYVTGGQGATSMLSNALGLNGAAGNAAATNAFQAGPGYQFQVDQATDAAARKASALGMAASGNTLDAITRLSSNLANNEYSNWQSGLSGLASQGLSAANAVSGNNAAAGGYQYGGSVQGSNLAQQLALAQAGVNQSAGQGLAGIDTSLGTNLANINTGLGNSLVNNATGIATKQAGNSINDATEQDRTDSANNGIFSGLLQKGLGTVLSGGLTSFLPGGLSNFSNASWG